MAYDGRFVDEIKRDNLTIIVERNGAGGLRYISDSIGGGVVIFDSSLCSIRELFICLDHFIKYSKNHT